MSRIQHSCLNQPLRIGLLVDSLEGPAWTKTLIDEIQDSDFATITLIVRNSPSENDERFTKKLSRWRREFLFIGYSKADRWANGAKEADAFELLDLEPVAKSTTLIDVTPRRTKFYDFIEGADLEAIKAEPVDVFIRFGFRILQGEVLQLAAFGIWSFHHGDNAIYRGAPPGFWEVFEGNPVTGVTLQRLTEEIDNGLVLDKTFSVTDMFSVEANKQNAYWNSLYSLPRQLQQLHRMGPEAYFASRQPLNEPAFYTRRLYKIPGNREFLSYLFRYLPGYVAGRLRRSTSFDHWYLLYDLRDRMTLSPRQLRRIEPPPDRFWADPFPVVHNDRYYVFIEEFIYSTGRGRIAVFDIDENGHRGEVMPALELPCHMSYPFVFKWQDVWYMMPETSETLTLELYRCERFPDRWSLEHVIMRDRELVDATLFQRQGHWYLFANEKTHPQGSTFDTLHLFVADDPLSNDWQPHPMNPLIVDPRSSRPAGHLFERDGRLFRPAQDCSYNYGSALVINEVHELTPTTYRESVVQRVAPEWDRSARGFHTWNRCGRLTVADAFRLRRKWERH